MPVKKYKPHFVDAHLQDVFNGAAFLVQDGAMGTMLQRAGLSDICPVADLLNLEDPAAITNIHSQYVEAGAELILTNTFNANAQKLAELASVDAVVKAGISCAREAGARYVGADIGPLGALLEPLGEMPFDTAYELFAEQVRAARDGGADLIVIETMSNLLEAKAALLAVKEWSDLPAIVTMTFEEDGRTFMGTPPQVAALVLSALGASAVGANCSLGPAELAPLIEDMSHNAICPISVRPNAGLPQMVNGKTVFDLTPDEFANALPALINSGATLLGSCCGTDPDFTAKIKQTVGQLGTPEPRTYFQGCAFASAHQMVGFDTPDEDGIIVIGERINPTGNRKMKEALKSADHDYAASLAITQEEAGADAIDVNVGLPEIDEPAAMVDVMQKVQAVTPLPLVIDSSDPVALEQAVRKYAGRALINSVNGSEKSLQTVLPLAEHYGCAVIGLTLDDDGLPQNAKDRVRIAHSIVERAKEEGVMPQNIIIDCLTMPVSAGKAKAADILDAIKLVKSELGVRTTLGVSNISFGLPARPLFNSIFLADAIGAGLDFPIIDPNSPEYQKVIITNRALNGQDAACASYIAAFQDWDGNSQNIKVKAGEKEETATDEGSLSHAVLTGQSTMAIEAATQLLQTMDGVSILNDVLIPALDNVGASYEQGTMYLPQMLAAAEAAKAALETVKDAMGSSEEEPSYEMSGPVLLATVRGDVHDIGKNIVKMLLENYGFPILDLGRDVAPEDVLAAALEKNSPLVGLSALMTTTVPSMKETIQLIKEKAPETKIVVGGAVLSSELAESIGADFYAKDAVETARIAKQFT